MIHIYYGDGKGKTTRAAGLAVRNAGADGKIIFCQFLKDGTSSEIKILDSINNIECRFADRNFGFTWLMTDDEKRQAAECCTELFDSVCADSDKHTMIVLDEGIDAVNCGFIDDDYFIEKICEMSENAEIVVTGHKPDEKILSAGDYVTEFRKQKHPFDKGLSARKGIEY